MFFSNHFKSLCIFGFRALSEDRKNETKSIKFAHLWKNLEILALLFIRLTWTCSTSKFEVKTNDEARTVLGGPFLAPKNQWRFHPLWNPMSWTSHSQFIKFHNNSSTTSVNKHTSRRIKIGCDCCTSSLYNSNHTIHIIIRYRSNTSWHKLS
jgi:hypothetical protein